MSFEIVSLTSGSITWKEFENKKAGIKKKLVFDISIKIDYLLNEKRKTGILSLHFIELPNISLKVEGFFNKKKSVAWENLIGKEYQFPINPNKGYIDGSFYLFAHNPCDVIKVRFVQMENKTIDIELTGYIDFSYENVDSITGIKKYSFSELVSKLEINE